MQCGTHHFLCAPPAPKTAALKHIYTHAAMHASMHPYMHTRIYIHAQLFLTYSQDSRQLRFSAAVAAKARAAKQKLQRLTGAQLQQQPQQPQPSKQPRLPAWALAGDDGSGSDGGAGGGSETCSWLDKGHSSRQHLAATALGSPQSTSRKWAGSWPALERLEEGAGGEGEGEGKEGSPGAGVGFGRVTGARVTFVQFMQLCEDRGVLPHCITPDALEHIFRCVCVGGGCREGRACACACAHVCVRMLALLPPCPSFAPSLLGILFDFYASPLSNDNILMHHATPSTCCHLPGALPAIHSMKNTHIHTQTETHKRVEQLTSTHMMQCTHLHDHIRIHIHKAQCALLEAHPTLECPPRAYHVDVLKQHACASSNSM